jgi:glutaredoxin
MSKRIVEVFSAGCPACEPTVQLVQSLSCPSCDVQVLDMRTDAAQAKARAYGVQRVPAVAVNGTLAGCCEGAADAQRLRGLGVGTPA